VRDISQAFSAVHNSRQELDSKITFIKNTSQVSLDSFFAAYQQTHKSIDTIKTLKKIVDLLPLLYIYPQNTDAIDLEKVANYVKKIKNFETSLDSIQLSNADFTALKKVMKDRILELESEFIEYAAAESEKTVTESRVETLVNILAVSLSKISYINGSTVVNDFKTRANSYISADLGLAAIPELSIMSPYLGTNIYLRPINPKYPITWRNNIGEDFFRRFSFLIGLTVTSLKKDDSRADLLGTFNLITGAGFRVSDGVRINGGTVWYSQVNPNPLNTNKNIVCSGFVSLSFDLDVTTVFHKLFTTTQIPTKFQ
jgi:hypothetical protein